MAVSPNQGAEAAGSTMPGRIWLAGAAAKPELETVCAYLCMYELGDSSLCDVISFTTVLLEHLVSGV